MPAQYVKPFVKTNKSDYIDASALPTSIRCWMRLNLFEAQRLVAYVRPRSSMSHAELQGAAFVNASQSARAWIRPAVFRKVRRRLPSPGPL
jgi:hypothetical protein